MVLIPCDSRGFKEYENGGVDRFDYNRLFKCRIDRYCLFDISHLLIKNVKVITNDIGQCGKNAIRS